MITGQVLRQERRKLDVNVTTLAQEIGYSRQHVHRIEKGLVILTPERIKAYRDALTRAAVSKG